MAWSETPMDVLFVLWMINTNAFKVNDILTEAWWYM